MYSQQCGRQYYTTSPPLRSRFLQYYALDIMRIAKSVLYYIQYQHYTKPNQLETFFYILFITVLYLLSLLSLFERHCTVLYCTVWTTALLYM